MSVEKQLDAWNAGMRGGVSFGTSNAETAAFAAGQQAGAQQGGGAGGAAGGGAGGLLLVSFLFLAPVAFVLGICLYPLPGVLTLLGISLVIEILGDGVNGLAILLAVLVSGAAFFMLGLLLERRLEAFAIYRHIRHALRLLFVGFVANVIIFAFRGAGEFSPQTSFLDRLSFLHVALVIAAMVGAHFLSRRLDAKYGSSTGFFARFRLRRGTADEQAAA